MENLIEKFIKEKISNRDLTILHYLEATNIQKLVGLNMCQEIIELMEMTRESFISQTKQFWEEYRQYLEWYNKALSYLNRYYLKDLGSSIIEKGFQVFERIIKRQYQKLFPNEMNSLKDLFSKLKQKQLNDKI